MSKPSSKALQALAKNLRTLMSDEHSAYRTERHIADKAKKPNGKHVSYKTIQRIVREDPDEAFEATLDTVEAIAKVFGLDAWQLLIPNLQPGDHPTIKRDTVVEV